MVQEPDIASCEAMRHVLVGGEALPPALAARFQERLPHAHLHNAYGPTETTVDATGKVVHTYMTHSVASGFRKGCKRAVGMLQATM